MKAAHTHTQFNTQTIVPANAGASNVQTTQLTIAARLSCSVYLPVVDCRSVICRWPVYGKVSFQTGQTEPAEQSEQMSIWMWKSGQADNLCFLMFDHPASVQRGERGKWLSHWLLCFACSFTAITTHHTDHHHRRCSFHFISFIHYLCSTVRLCWLFPHLILFHTFVDYYLLFSFFLFYSRQCGNCAI